MDVTAPPSTGMDDPGSSGDTSDHGAPSLPVRLASALRRPLLAGIVLSVVYVLGFLATDTGGSLSSDIGSKVATLEAVDTNGGADLDVGYWAEDVDPDGDLHPLYSTREINGRWISVTTLPLLGPAIPLWAIGGYRAVVILAMLGSVCTAFAARALARRLGAGSGWLTYWVVGLASPVAIYAFVFWEHSVGLALMAWGVVLLVDLLHGRNRLFSALGAGAMFGLAATMRTEALLYGALGVAAVLLARLIADRFSGAALLRALAAGSAALVGVVLPLVANDLLERWWLGSSIRASRASGAAADSGLAAASRVDESLKYLFGVNRFGDSLSDAALGVLVVVPLVVGAALLMRSRDRLVPMALVLTSWALLLLLLFDASQFIPGLFVASPLAALGLVAMWSSTDRIVVGAIAALAIPGVLVTAYVGGAAAQWGSRYMLLSGLLLLVLATLDLPRLPRVGAVALIAISALVTASGLMWTVQRSEDLARFGEVVRDRPEPVVASLLAFQFREIGAYYEDGRYLTAPRKSDRDTLARVLREKEVDEFALISRDPDGTGEPVPMDGYEPASSETVAYIGGTEVLIVHYDATD